MPETEDFQDLTGDLEYAMFVVTTTDGERRAGCLVGFTTQCSIDPPRYVVCLSKANHTFAVALEADVLVVHVVGAGQLDMARHFGELTGDDVDKFATWPWQPGPGGAPVLSDCPAWFAGRILDRFDLGDHMGFWLEPIDVSTAPGTHPLMFSAVKDLVPGHRA